MLLLRYCLQLLVLISLATTMGCRENSEKESLTSWRDLFILRVAQFDSPGEYRQYDKVGVGWDWAELTPQFEALPPDPWVAEILCQIGLCGSDSLFELREDHAPWVMACHALGEMRPARYQALLQEAQCTEGTHVMERLVREYRPP